MDNIKGNIAILLTDLTDNSNQMMVKLRNLEWDNQTHAAEIVEVMETHLQQV